MNDYQLGAFFGIIFGMNIGYGLCMLYVRSKLK